LVMIRSLFERDTVLHLEAAFKPIPPVTEDWLTATDLSAWRRNIQHRRTMADAEFFARFLPDLAVPASNLKRKT